jgi:hypothetical protein
MKGNAWFSMLLKFYQHLHPLSEAKGSFDHEIDEDIGHF